MKKIVAMFISLVVFSLAAFPCSATYNEKTPSVANLKVETIYLENEISVMRTIVTYESSARASTRSGYVTDTYKSGSTVIAEVTLNATFSYNGASSSVISAYSDYTTYGGWSYGSESISKSGATAKLSAKLSKLLLPSIGVNTSLSCSPTGVLY